MNAIILVDFNGTPVRVMNQGGNPWFVLTDVCRVLEHTNPSMAAKALDEDERSALNITDPHGRAQQTTIISESGLYSLILNSRKPQARAFKRWITSEVIPAIRRTGGYMGATREETPEELVLRAMRMLQDTVDRQKAQRAIATSKAAALDRISNSEGSF